MEYYTEMSKSLSVYLLLHFKFHFKISKENAMNQNNSISNQDRFGLFCIDLFLKNKEQFVR